MNEVPTIRRELRVVDKWGNLLKVTKVDEERGTVSLRSSDGHGYTLGIRELRNALRDGSFARAADDEDVDEDDELDSDESAYDDEDDDDDEDEDEDEDDDDEED